VDALVAAVLALLNKRALHLVVVTVCFVILLVLIYRFVKSWFGTPSPRQTIAHWSWSALTSLLLVATGLAVGVVFNDDKYFLSVLTPFLLLAGLLGRYAWNLWWPLYRLPNDRLIVGIIPFHKVSDAAAEDVANIQHAITRELDKWNEQGVVLEWRLLSGKLADAQWESIHTTARRRGNSVTDGRSHIVLLGNVSRYGGQIFVDVDILTANPLRGRSVQNIVGDRSISFQKKEPESSELRNLAASQIADLVALLYGVAHYKIGNWDAAIAVLEKNGLLEAHAWKALCYFEVANRSAAGAALLRKAIDTWKTILKSIPRESAAANWAAAQNNLGNALTTLAALVGSAEAIRCLREAILAFSNALAVYKRETLPGEWAMVQVNLANTLWDLGTRSAGDEANQCLAESTSACRRALEVYSRKKTPREWATTQNNLGNALQERAIRADSGKAVGILREAAAAYGEALVALTHREDPQFWAGAQNNLGNVLQEMGKRSLGKERDRYLLDSIHAYEHALKVRTREAFPQEWATTQNNMGNALSILGEFTRGKPGDDYLSKGIDAHNNALEVRTRESAPQLWAQTQCNLGNALSRLGIRREGESGQCLLLDAVAAYRKALEVTPRDDLPRYWATSHLNLGNTLSWLGERAGGRGREYFSEAILAYDRALEVFTAGDFPQEHDGIQRNKSIAVKALTGLQGR